MSKLPTEWDLLNTIWHIINQQVEEEILLSSEAQDEIETHIESHTAAHTAALRDRVKELEGNRKSDCIAFANWLSNQVLRGRSIEKLWRDYEMEVLK